MLPSGKVVDQSTIDRHSEEEAKWGRLPSDPFTGLEFTSHRKAILNVSLKARIEKFLVENSEHFKSVPRSLGSCRVRRSRNRHVSQIANLFQMQCSGHSAGGTVSTLLRHKKTATATLSSSENPTSLTVNHHPSSAKRQRLNENSDYHVSSDTMLSLQSFKGKQIPEKLLTMMASTATQTSATATASFTNASKCLAFTECGQEESVLPTGEYGNNIDHVLQQALQHITRFTQLPWRDVTAGKSDKKLSLDQDDACVKCQSTDYLYKLRNCGHLVCRRCLIPLMQQEYCLCNVSLKTGDVERFHKL